MGLIGTIVTVVMIVLFALTALTEPALTAKYAKAYFTSGMEAYQWVKEQFKGGDHDNTTERKQERTPSGQRT